MKRELLIESVFKTFGNKEALKGITARFDTGIIGLLGPNGAGKSTLMRLIATIEKPTGGTIKYNGTDILKEPDIIRRVLGYLPQDFGVYPNMTAFEFLMYMAAMKGISPKSAKTRINELIVALNLSPARKTLLGGYSGGMKQRVGIAQALLNDPQIIIVDEPTTGLDPEERIRFRNLLANLSESKIIILSTHIVSDVESIAPRIAILSNGTLSGIDTPENLIKAAENSVWQSVVSIPELNALQKEYSVSSTLLRNDGVHVRFISREKPDIPASPAPPTLEDSYLFHVAKDRMEK